MSSRSLRIDQRHQTSELQCQPRGDGGSSKPQTSACVRLSVGERLEHSQCGAAEIIDPGQIDDDIRPAGRMVEQGSFELGGSGVAEPPFKEEDEVPVFD